VVLVYTKINTTNICLFFTPNR